MEIERKDGRRGWRKRVKSGRKGRGSVMKKGGEGGRDEEEGRDAKKREEGKGKRRKRESELCADFLIAFQVA